MIDKTFLDSIIDPVIKQGTEAEPTWVTFVEANLIKLTLMAREAFLNQSTLLRIEPAINICGDIHGQLPDLLRIFETNGYPPETRYLFMGDLVDRGRYNIEVISMLFAMKLKYPESVYLLRGNHEDDSLTRVYGFMDECKRRYSMKLWKSYVNAFDCMPLAAVVGSRIFCVHGGISPSMKHITEIEALERPSPVGSVGLRADLLWADPDASGLINSYVPNAERGCSFMFGKEAVIDFLKNNDLDLLCRAHEVAEDGYQFNFDRRAVTVFSAPNYSDAYTNSAAVMKVSESLMCSFNVLQPKSKARAILTSPKVIKRRTSPVKRVSTKRTMSPKRRISPKRKVSPTRTSPIRGSPIARRTSPIRKTSKTIRNSHPGSPVRKKRSNVSSTKM